MDILKRLMAEADQAELVKVRSESTSVSFEANRLKKSQVDETSGLAVRVVKDGRLGFAASSDDGTEDRLVRNVLESAAYGDEVPLAFPRPQPAPGVRTFDTRIADLSVARMVQIGQGLVEMMLAVEPEARVNLELTRGVAEMSLRNHTGFEASVESTPLSISSEISRVQGDDVLLLFGVSAMTVWSEDYVADFQRLAQQLVLAKRRATIRSGRMPVLFSPSGMLALVLPLVAGLDGKSAYTRVSPLSDKIEAKLFDDKITVMDDGTLDGRPGSGAYDDEGVPHQRNVLVERGILKAFYYDLKTAAQAGVESTGNGSRQLFSPPSPALTNLVLEMGQTPLREMLSGINHGLWVEIPLGLGQGNVVSGAFSNSWSVAYKIEEGEIVGRVKDASIAGNVYDLLQKVASVSRETQWVYGSYCLPHILLDDMNVVSKE